MGFRDDGITRCDGGGEVSSTNAVEGEGKVIGTKDNDRSDGSEAGADIFFEVESGVAPGLFAHCGGGLAKLVGGAGEFYVFEAWGDGQSGFRGGGCDDG